MVVLILVLTSMMTWATASGQSPLDAALDVAEQAAIEKVAAERIRSEKVAAQQSAIATAGATIEAAKKASEAKVAAERAGAAEAKAVAEKIATALEAEAAANQAFFYKQENRTCEKSKSVFF